MRVKNRICKTVLTILLAMNLAVLPVCASDSISVFAQARYYNVSSAALTIGFDSNHVVYCSISLTPYSHCTGLDGMMRLLDSDGNLLKSWAVYDHTEPYSAEYTWQCEYGKTYTVTFQGYAYGEGSMYDDIVLSVSDICD